MIIDSKHWILTGLLVLIITTWGLPDDKSDPEKPPSPTDNSYYQVEKVEEVVVTASMTPKSLKDCAATVNVVNRTDIDSLPSSNALNILNSTPGIFVNRSGDFGRADVDIRGLGQNCRRVAVLVDGIPEKMGLFGCAVSHAFPLDNVERIEVVKGPASVLYGGEALGGAVNIISRLPQKKFEADLSSSFGSFNSHQMNLKLGGNLDRFKYFLTFDRRNSDGHVENSDYSGYSFSGKLVYDWKENSRLCLLGKYFDGKKYEPGSIDYPVSDFWNDYERGSVDLSFSHLWKQNEFLAKVYRNFGTHRFSDGWDSRDYTNGALLRFTNRSLAGNELTVGADARFFGGKNYGSPKGEWDKKEGSVFLQNDHIFNSHWIFSTGARLQWDCLYGLEWCPYLGLVFQMTHDTLFRASISKGFRSPQLNELYMFPPANPNLEPERVWNYELGFEQEFGKRLTVKGCVFHMKGSNLIQTVPNPAGSPRFIYANTGEFSFYGAEIELEAFIKRFLSGHIAYSYLNPGDHSRGIAGQKLDVSLRFGYKSFYAALQGQYIGDYYAGDFSKNRISPYFILNMRFIFSVLKNIDLLVDIDNVFDKEYHIYGEFPGLTAGLYRMPGRNARVGFRFHL